MAISSRGDALTPYLSSALRQRYNVVGHIDMELTHAQRLAVAAATFRPSRREWVERFYKSDLAYRLRTRNGAHQLRDLHSRIDLTFQVHALYEQVQGPHVIYVDCTHRQTAEQWPPWNPLHGAALRRWYERERVQYHRAAHLFAFSQQTALSLTADYGVPQQQVTVVGAGVNFDRLPTEAGRTADRPPTVLFIGNDFVRKGGEVLLRAFAEVRRTVPRARLRIAGTRYPVAPQPGVEVLGPLSDRTQIARLYADADVFALPSFYDPFPLVLLEAMAYGLPTVSTATCGVPEVVTDGVTGVLTPTGDARALAAALTQILLRPDTALTLGRQGRLRAETEFLWPHVVQRMTPALDRLGYASSAPGLHSSRSTDKGAQRSVREKLR